jgi:DNA-binding LytR/AlgR family response regulator
MALERILVHQSEGRRIPLEPAEIYYLEAEDYQTVIRLRGKQLLRDSRGLGQVERVLRSDFLIRIHRNFIVNLRRVREIRTRKEGDGWELRLEPPVNRIIPIGRTYEARLWKAFGE